MITTAKLTIDLAPELRDYLMHVSEKRQVSPSSLATNILQCCLRKEACQSRPIDVSALRPLERRQGPALYNPEEIVADIQRTLEAMGDELPGFNPGDPLAPEVEAIISQVESERGND